MLRVFNHIDSNQSDRSAIEISRVFTVFPPVTTVVVLMFLHVHVQIQRGGGQITKIKSFLAKLVGIP